MTIRCICATLGAVLVLAAPGVARAQDGAPAPAPAATPTPAPAPAPPPVVEDLYDPGRAARHAAVNYAAIARTRPSPTAAHVAKLRLLTEDRTTEIVLVVARATNYNGGVWLQIRIPGRSSGTLGWVPREALGQLRRVATWLRIDKSARRLTLIRSGVEVMRAPVGIGRPRSPTPSGEWYVRNVLSGRRLGAIYGPKAFGTSARSKVLTDWPGGGVIGIHGTNQPGLIPGAVSHGCVRLRNRDVLRLARLMPVGTPVSIF